jgi:hypothetical protein
MNPQAHRSPHGMRTNGPARKPARLGRPGAQGRELHHSRIRIPTSRRRSVAGQASGGGALSIGVVWDDVPVTARELPF